MITILIILLVLMFSGMAIENYCAVKRDRAKLERRGIACDERQDRENARFWAGRNLPNQEADLD